MENIVEYSNNDILNLLYIHSECQKIVSRTCRLFNQRYPNLPPMTRGKFRRYESNFLQTGSVNRTKNYTKPVTGNEDNHVNVLAYFEAYPRNSIPAASQDLGISVMSIQRILNSFKMHPYSEIRVQGFHVGDELRRVEFCENALVSLQEDEAFLSKIIWTDESKFNREGIVNRRNNHYWARENPHVARQGNFQERFGFNVFCIILDNRVHYEIYNQNLNEQVYLELLRTVVINFMNGLPEDIRNRCWYQLDGAPAHSTRQVYLQLTDMFEDRWIGPNGPRKWPPRSPDLTPCDYYLWGRIKSLVYSRPVENREDLVNRVRVAFRELDGDEIRRASTNESRLRILKCLEQNGGHIEHL